MRPLLLLALCCAAQAQLPDYRPAHQVTGTIHVWGSTQMGDLLHRYEAGFHVLQPGVQFDDRLKSTITAVAGVYTGRAQVGLLGRAIWPVEVQAFTSIKGYAPTVLEVATGSYDVPKAAFALMVMVPRGNPLRSLTLEQIERVFGNRNPARTWGDLGLKGAWARRPVHPYGFSIENDKSQSFAETVFRPGERWTPSLREFPPELGPHGEDAGELIVRAAAADPDGICLSNIHYATPGVRALALGTPAVTPSRQTVADRSYPLTRAVYLVVDRRFDEATGEFLRYVLSRQGEQAVVREGNYLPLPGPVAEKQLATLNAH